MKSRNFFVETLLAEQKFSILAHRGQSGGNIIQNTIESVALAYQLGADMVELDVAKSKDETYYLFHTKMEQSLLGTERLLQDMTSEEIAYLFLINHSGWPSGKTLDTLADLLACLPRSYLINIDKSWPYWTDQGFWDLFYKSGTLDQVIFKSPASAEYLDILQDLTYPINYFPLIQTREDWRLVSSYSFKHLLGAELIFNDLDQDILSQSFIEELKAYPILLANALDMGEGYNMSAGLTDTKAIRDKGKSWGKLIGLGFNVIQTDFPSLLKDFRQNIS